MGDVVYAGAMYTPIQNAATRVAALLSGEVDFIQDVPVQDLERVASTDGLKVIKAPQNRVIFLGMNQGDADLTSDNIDGKNPFADVRVRQAMNIAINREAIQKVVMRDQSIPAGVAMPPFVNGWTAELDTVPATDVATGKARIFTEDEISADAILASVCLPHLYKAVEIEGRHYWDGGLSANPPIFHLVEQSHAGDTLIVQINPETDPVVPRDVDSIAQRVNRLTFNASFRREIELVERCRAAATEGALHDHRFHLIEAGEVTGPLGEASKLRPDGKMIATLHQAGRAAAERWLAESFAGVGTRSTTDLKAKFLNDAPETTPAAVA